MYKLNKKKNNMSLEKQEAKAAFIFIIPFFIGFLMFGIAPFLYALFISFVDFNDFKALNTLKWAGLDNYIAIFKDSIALSAYFKSFYYTIIYVPLLTIVGFFAAVLLNRAFYWKSFSRSLFLMPYVANIVAISLVFSMLFDPFGGFVNSLLNVIGIENPPLWFAGSKTAILTTAIVAAWANFPFQMVVYLAALQGVSKDLYEAAEIDGATKIQQLFKITLPIVSPTSFFLVITATIGSFQNFTIFNALTRGGPGTSSRVSSLNIYEEAFSLNHYSYSAAQAILLFLIIMVISAIQWRVQKKWVHY
ncbi:sugar ABC transporter permease [Paenibacillus sp. LjRoot153]|uniref:carbohydrate ABC transporter permease n=1 Tax=Paenibacillus sp. LjRoot153 TaxID=3342270 RepID=UPI003ECCDE6F